MSKALVFCSVENCLHSFDFKMNSALEKCLQIGLVKWCQAAGFLAGQASEAQDPTEPYIFCSVFWDQPLKICVNLSLNLCSVVGGGGRRKWNMSWSINLVLHWTLQVM